jgi:hypothetical protein
LRGEVRIDLKIGNTLIPTTAVVSDNIAEGLIGYDWLAANDVFWGFGFGRILIHGEVVPLTTRPEEGFTCNRFVVQENITVPSHCEAIIPARIVFGADKIKTRSEKTLDSDSWIIEPGETEKGLYIAGALLPARSHNIPTRVVNASNRNICLKEGEVLGEAQVLRATDVVVEDPQGAEVDTDRKWVSALVEQVHGSISESEKAKLEEILTAYQICFSPHDFDLGRMSVVRHQIDTGNSRPLKQ